MTTAQESPNGHLPQKGYLQDALFADKKVFPPPFRVESPSEANRADLPADKAHTNSDIATAAAVPEPGVAQPTNDVVERQDGVPITPILAHNEPLPERCQFFFSDGRQCTMARSDVHPSLCTYHSEREEQLFGAPGPGGGGTPGGSYDLPELYSACRDLSTPAGVSRALAQVFRLLALRRISRQEAATFAKLGHLLLQSISAARAEFDAESSREGPAANVSQQEQLRGVDKDHQELSRVNKVDGALPAEVSPRAPSTCFGSPAKVPGKGSLAAEKDSARFASHAESALTRKRPEPTQNEHLQNRSNSTRAESTHPEKQETKNLNSRAVGRRNQTGGSRAAGNHCVLSDD